MDIRNQLITFGLNLLGACRDGLKLLDACQDNKVTNEIERVMNLVREIIFCYCPLIFRGHEYTIRLIIQS